MPTRLCFAVNGPNIRVIAEGMTNQESREFMLRLSEDYERLADATEKVGVLPPERKAEILSGQ